MNDQTNLINYIIWEFYGQTIDPQQLNYAIERFYKTVAPHTTTKEEQ